MDRISSSQVHRPCMAKWNPDASSKRGWRSRPWIGVYRSLTKWGRGTSLKELCVFSSFSARFLYGFPCRFQRAWAVLWSMKHLLDVVRVGAWNSREFSLELKGPLTRKRMLQFKKTVQTLMSNFVPGLWKKKSFWVVQYTHLSVYLWSCLFLVRESAVTREPSQPDRF